MFTVADARRCAVDLFMQSAILKTQPRSSLTLDADVLLQHFLKKPRSWLFAHDDTDISSIREAFYAAAERRCTGLPIAYITGEKDFWGLSFHVSPDDVLIPKPDTELLVERSLAIIREKAAALRQDQTLFILDPCTGSGCVAISILYTLEAEGIRNIYCIAADISPAALAIARLNAQRLLSAETQTRLYIIEGDMRALPETITRFEESLQLGTTPFPKGADRTSPPLPSNTLRFDLIAANPPYVPSTLTQELLKDGRNEPALALDGGSDGLDFIRILTNNTRTVLNRNGVLLSEVGEYHAQAASKLFETAGFSDIRIHQDLAGQDRLIEGVSEQA